jgi:hypothetical protein
VAFIWVSAGRERGRTKQGICPPPPDLWEKIKTEKKIYIVSIKTKKLK